MKTLAPLLLLALATACDSGDDKDTEVTDDTEETEESEESEDTEETEATDDTEETEATDDTDESGPTDDTEESETDTEEPGDGVSPEFVEGYWTISEGTSDCSLIAVAEVEDPQGDSTIDQLGGYLRVMEGSTEVLDENAVICNTIGDCSGSLAESRYDVECDDADGYTVFMNIFDEDGNSTGYTELPYVDK